MIHRGRVTVCDVQGLVFCVVTINHKEDQLLYFYSVYFSYRKPEPSAAHGGRKLRYFF